MLFALSNILVAVLAVAVPGTSIGRGFNARPLEQLSREPRRIEILGQKEDITFSVRRRLLSTFYDPLFSSGRTGATLRRLLPTARLRG
jgi:hypothetical protein